MNLNSLKNPASWIKEKRKKINISQAKLAELTNIKQYKISQWELNKSFPDSTSMALMDEFFERIEKEIKQGVDHNFREHRNTKAKFKLSKKGKSRRGTIKSHNEIEQLPELVKQLSPTHSNKTRKAISLFSGCGGLCHGVKSAGFNIIGFAELDSVFAQNYILNFPDADYLGSDVASITSEEVALWKDSYGEIDLLFGGPPCQGFSLAGKRDRWDPRNQLFREMVRIGKILKPKVILFENVRLLTSMKTPEGGFVIDLILSEFTKAGYNCAYKVLNAQNYGVPQFRERVFVVCYRKDFGPTPTIPQKTHGVVDKLSLIGSSLQPIRTFKDATKDLLSLESGESDPDDLLHFAITHPDHIIDMLKDIPEGESAHNHPDPEKRPNSGYNTTYKRIMWDEPCSTISTNFEMISGCRNVHPSNTRSLTIREALRSQTFPDTFKFYGSGRQVRTMIGNAVPPKLGEVVASHILKEMQDYM